MRKVLGIAAILLFCLTAMASASPTNWTLGVLASSSDGWVGDRWNVIGVWSAYTDGMNTSPIAYGDLPPGREGGPIPAGGGRWGAVKQTTNPVGTVDMRSKYSSTIPQSKTWTMNVYYYNVLDTGSPNSLTLTIVPDVDKDGVAIAGVSGDLPDVDGSLTYLYDFSLNGGPVTTYRASELANGISYSINTPHQLANADTLTVTVRTIPEPGSLLALGSGIIGLALTRRYRRR